MTLPHDQHRCHGLKLAQDAPTLADCWACERNRALQDMGPLTPVWTRPAVVLAVDESGVARVVCQKRVAVD